MVLGEEKGDQRASLNAGRKRVAMEVVASTDDGPKRQELGEELEDQVSSNKTGHP